MKKEIAYFTVCNITYFPKAIVLAESLFKETGNILHIYVADKKNELVPKLPFYEIKWVEDENIENHQYARDVSGSLLRPDAKRRS